MPFYLIHGDITKIKADAIVNAANPSLLGGGGVDGAIHRAAGPELREECAALGGCRPGEAKRTAAYRLPALYVIHTVGPVWSGGGNGEREILGACYRNSLALAEESGCSSVAFPLISAGAYGYPQKEALAAAEEEIRAFLASGRTGGSPEEEPENEMTVYLVLWEDPALLRNGYPELRRMLEGPDRPVPAAQPQSVRKRKSFLSGLALRKDKKEASHPDSPAQAAPSYGNASFAGRREEAAKPDAAMFEDRAECDSVKPVAPPMFEPYAPASSLKEALSMIDESFSEMLLRKIDERGMKDSECYRRANVDRKLFSKIRSDPHYRPSKTTAIAFAIALELSPEETDELLLKAGYALSPSSVSDVIIRYYIGRGIYNVFEINEALYAFDQKQLGA